MTIELRVEGMRQSSPMCCWWTCMSMVLNYYGQRCLYPWDYRPDFRRPMARGPSSVIPDLHYPDIDDMMRIDRSLAAASAHTFEQPYEWYDHGLPRNPHAFRMLSDITGFRGFNRPAFGRWTADDVESRLRSFGPYVFCGFWNGFPHAILVIGLLQDGADVRVVTIDPAIGFPTDETLVEFNARMDQRMREYNFNGLNPLYLPQRRPVRDVVIHDS